MFLKTCDSTNLSFLVLFSYSRKILVSDDRISNLFNSLQYKTSQNTKYFCKLVTKMSSKSLCINYVIYYDSLVLFLPFHFIIVILISQVNTEQNPTTQQFTNIMQCQHLAEKGSKINRICDSFIVYQLQIMHKNLVKLLMDLTLK